MDLKRAWRNGFLASLIFALPLSDLYYFQHEIFNVNGSTSNEDIDKRKFTGASDVEGNGQSIPAGSLADALLAAKDSDPVYIREAGLHFSPDYILQSVDLNCEGNPDIPADIEQIIDINTDTDFIASLPFGFGNSTAYAPGQSGTFAPFMFASSRSPGAASGFQSNLEDVVEAPFAEQSPESSGQSETAESEDTPNVHSGFDSDSLHSVPEPSSLMMLTIGSLSAASLFHWRRTKPPASHS